MSSFLHIQVPKLLNTAEFTFLISFFYLSKCANPLLSYGCFVYSSIYFKQNNLICFQYNLIFYDRLFRVVFVLYRNKGRGMLANRLCIEEIYWVYVQNSTAISMFIISFTYEELQGPIIKLLPLVFPY